MRAGSKVIYERKEFHTVFEVLIYIYKTQMQISMYWWDPDFHTYGISLHVPDIMDDASRLRDFYSMQVKLTSAPNPLLSIALIKHLRENQDLVKRKMSISTIAIQVHQWFYSLQRTWQGLAQKSSSFYRDIAPASLLIPVKTMLSAISFVEHHHPDRVQISPSIVSQRKRPLMALPERREEEATKKPKPETRCKEIERDVPTPSSKNSNSINSKTKSSYKCICTCPCQNCSPCNKPPNVTLSRRTPCPKKNSAARYSPVCTKVKKVKREAIDLNQCYEDIVSDN